MNASHFSRLSVTFLTSMLLTCPTLAARGDESRSACFCMALIEACETCQAEEEAQQRGSEPFFATQPVRLTSPEQFSRAGEAYFSPDRRWIIFQAVPADVNAYSYMLVDYHPCEMYHIDLNKMTFRRLYFLCLQGF